MEMEFVYLIAALVGIALLFFLSDTIDNDDALVCRIITYTIHPKLILSDCLSLLIRFGIITLGIYLLCEYTWVIITLIVSLVIYWIFSWRYEYSMEMRIYELVIRLLKKEQYEVAENILRQAAKETEAEEVGKLHTPLLKLIRSLKEKDGKRKPKVWNIHIYDPIQPNRALVPMSHYPMNTDENI